jgi:nitrogen fixation/metabolism regulation signal transduction histidine kinase
MVVQNDKIRNLLAKVSVGQESRVDPEDVTDPELDIDGANDKDALRPLLRGQGATFGQVTNKKAMAASREGRILSEISEASTGILDMYTQLQERQQSRNDARNQQINKVIEETKKYMMITLIIGFLTTIIAGLVVPGKVVLPFKKIRDVIRELRECNFDVTISYSQDDEIGEIAGEMNKMIVAMKKFDELRRNLVELELRKFDILANMIHTPVLVGGADGQIHYINNSLYSLLGVESDQVISKAMITTSMPRSIIDAYELAIKRRAKIENIEIVIPRKKVEGEEVAEGEEYLFQGYANIVPVRSKESSHDYYLMVMSTQAFV